MQTSAVMSSAAELSKSKTSRQAMGWAVGLATAATVGAIAIPLCAAMIGGGVGALMGSAIGVIGGIDGHRAGVHEVQYRGMPADISGKLKMWREQTGETAAKVGKDIASSMAHSI